MQPLTRRAGQYRVGGARMHTGAMPDLPPNSELSTSLARDPDGVRLMLHGELDMNGVLDTERAIEAAAAAVPEGRLTIDLSELTFMDLFGARALLRVAD